jgi:ABC-2 type transport system ATP-binding protein
VIKPAILAISGLHKRYRTSPQPALEDVSLTINAGEIFALLGPNGAGKTTLINVVTGIVTPTSGQILVAGLDIVRDFRSTRQMIGLVPQELLVEAFESVWDTVRFSRRLFGKPANDAYIEQVLRDLSLWEKRHQPIRHLSGGMKRRVLIAKALSHEPSLLFLDEPSAGVDVELRRSMWELVRRLRSSGVTVILTTHYLEEAEEMADRVGIINHGKIVMVEETATLLQRFGKKQVLFTLTSPLGELPSPLKAYPVELSEHGSRLTYTAHSLGTENGMAHFLQVLKEAQISFTDFATKNSSLEEIFIQLVRRSP